MPLSPVARALINPALPLGAVLHRNPQIGFEVSSVLSSGSWWKNYDPGSGAPSIAMDLVNNRYYGGSLTSLLSGTLNVSAAGLRLNQINIAAIGSLLTALQGSACTIMMETSGGTSGSNGGLADVNSGTMAPLFALSGGSLRIYYGSSVDTGASTTHWNCVCFSACAWDSAGCNMGLNGVTQNETSIILPSVTSVNFGSWNGGSEFGGYLRRLIVYPRKLSLADVQTITQQYAPYTALVPTVFKGNHSIQCSSGQEVSAGNVLQYQYTQPWTFICAVAKKVRPQSAALIFGDVGNSPYYGYELWVDNAGSLHVRILASLSHYIGVYGSIDVCDGAWHVIGATYDGSGSAAGVKLYVDGVADTVYTESDNLGGNSITVSNDTWKVGNQVGYQTSYYFGGALDEVTLSNVARNASYMSAHATAATMPAVSDGNVQIHYAFEEGTGTTTADDSGNSYTGTLTSSSQWI
jgi:hypothetical protein